jgi:hypothetical protein
MMIAKAWEAAYIRVMREGGAHAGSPKSEHSPFMDINGRQS